jgi:hypothetical protein
MAKRPGILTGTAGVYYVAYQLAARSFHAAVTYGNAPSVDLLVGLLNGAATLSLQVKASSWALRTRGRGKSKKPDHYEWDVGPNSARLARPDLFFAFVDLKSSSEQLPDVFIIPSEVVFEYFLRLKPYFDRTPNARWRYHTKVEKIEQYKNNWDILLSYLNQKAGGG